MMPQTLACISYWLSFPWPNLDAIVYTPGKTSGIFSDQDRLAVVGLTLNFFSNLFWMKDQDGVV